MLEYFVRAIVISFFVFGAIFYLEKSLVNNIIYIALSGIIAYIMEAWFQRRRK